VTGLIGKAKAETEDDIRVGTKPDELATEIVDDNIEGVGVVKKVEGEIKELILENDTAEASMYISNLFPHHSVRNHSLDTRNYEMISGNCR